MADRKYNRRPLPSLTREHQEPQRDPFRCSSGGCILRADWFPGSSGIHDHSHGLCTYHIAAQVHDRDPVDVTLRLRERIDLHRAFVRLSVAKFVPDQNTGMFRAATLDTHQDPPRDILMAYPERMPIRDDEHHHQWVDRAREYLIEIIVSKASKARSAA